MRERHTEPAGSSRPGRGVEVSEDGDDALVARAQDHAQVVHGMNLPAEILLALASTLRPKDTEEDGG